jgi:hypothetical protein
MLYITEESKFVSGIEIFPVATMTKNCISVDMP